jgi:large subunit ribosomal protein L30
VPAVRVPVSRLSITLKKSAIGYNRGQRLTLKALGLRSLNQTVVHGDSRVLRGMVNKVRHLVHVEELPGE